MFEKTEAISKWRDSMAVQGRLSSTQIAELEAHLLDAMEALPSSPLSDEERFLVATHRIGRPSDLSHEYEKVAPLVTWRAPVFWATVGVAWVLGVEAILDTAAPLGAWAVARLSWSPVLLQAWAFVVYLGGPLVAFASVAAWMRRYSAAHPASIKALFTTVVTAASIRVGSFPLSALVYSRVRRGVDIHAWRSFQSAWQLAMVMGLLLVAAVGAFVLVRFRPSRTQQISS